MASEAAATINSDNEKSCSCPLYTYTLYFIRHAEALHNQLEKEAQSTALTLAISQGYDPNSSYAKQVQEEARRAILENDTMDDPPLSERGLEEARNAKRTLEQLIRVYELPEVEEVWVSPLQRTLQTAATIFPESCPDNNCTDSDGDGASAATASSSTDGAQSPIIRVKKEIEERQSGFACDKHSSFDTVRRRMTFSRFSLSCLRLDKLVLNGEIKASESIDSSNSIEEEVATGGDTLWEDKAVVAAASSMTNDTKKLQLQSTNNNNNDTLPSPTIITTTAIEDKSMLRERTKKLFHLLAETQSRSICLIGHKGYLRELERGPLGHEDAELFQNCEVRVYRLQLDVVGVADVVVDESVEGVIDCDGDVVGVRNDGSTVGSGRMSIGRERGSSIGSGPGSPVPVIQRAERIASSTDLMESRTLLE